MIICQVYRKDSFAVPEGTPDPTPGPIVLRSEDLFATSFGGEGKDRLKLTFEEVEKSFRVGLEYEKKMKAQERFSESEVKRRYLKRNHAAAESAEEDEPAKQPGRKKPKGSK